MKKLTINAYSFDELGKQEKQRVLEKYASVNVEDSFWYEHIMNEAKKLGFEIKEFDIDRRDLKMDILTSSPEIAENICNGENRHGEETDTYKLAKKFLNNLENLPEDEDAEPLHEEFDGELGREYLSILSQEYEYQTSEQAIKEFIEANDILFAKDGSPLPITYHMKDDKVVKIEFAGEACELK